MISTVTTSTVSSITSVTLIGALGAIGVVVLFSLLIQKELISSSNDGRMQRLQRALNIAIWPLIAVFVVIVLAKALEIFAK
jgi:nitrate reductase NapE component